MAGPSNSRRILVGLALSVLAPRASWGLVIDPFTTYTRPANALIMPFDLTPHRSTQLIVSNLNGISFSDPGRCLASDTGLEDSDVDPVSTAIGVVQGVDPD